MRRPWTPVFEKLEGATVCRVTLSQGMFALVDAKYIDAVMRCAWCGSCDGNRTYAYTGWVDGKKKKLALHQLIWQLLGKSGPVDHENNDGLDCRVSNLRPGPASLNMANARKTTRKRSSAFKGVSWHKKRRRWMVRLMVSRKSLHLGYFVDEHLAAHTYDAAAIKHFGAYAKLNFPQELAA